MKNSKHLSAKATKLDAARTWKQFEDHLIPGLRLSVIDRSIYSHLLRHSRLEGKRRLRFSILELARRTHISGQPVRDAVRRLIAYGVLRLVARTNTGHLVEVRLPHEIRAIRTAGLESRATKPIRPRFLLEQADFFHHPERRHAIHAREASLCFYCRKRQNRFAMCLDHVIPRVNSGRNSYRNLVSCCTECNEQKGQRSATDFLRWLYREQRVTASELKTRLAALRDLVAGKLQPPLP
jgi:DNA-binding Lrp family transcriptional regulator